MAHPRQPPGPADPTAAIYDDWAHAEDLTQVSLIRSRTHLDRSPRSRDGVGQVEQHHPNGEQLDWSDMP